MRETVRARLVSEAGSPIPIETVSKDGLVIFGESSAWPRRTGLRVQPVSVGTKKTLERIRREQGWKDDEMKLRYELRDGEICLQGVDEGSLPSGTWEFSLNVYDVRSRSRQRVELPKGGNVSVDIEVANDVRHLDVRQTSEWDGEVRRVLNDSELDRTDGVDWARDPATRANRRACAFNLLAVCRELGLIEAVHKIFLIEVDRMYVEVDSGFGDLLDARFHEPRPPAHPIHKRLLRRARDVNPDDYDLLSFRQHRNPSLQVVTATPQGDGRHLAEIDIDLGDVLDPMGFFIHVVEIIHPQRTDHLHDVPHRLEHTGAKPFLAYVPE